MNNLKIIKSFEKRFDDLLNNKQRNLKVVMCTNLKQIQQFLQIYNAHALFW